jgi:putative acetyltransferase
MQDRSIEIREDDLSGSATRALLALHLRGMQANSPAESVFALDLSGLQAPGVAVWTAWIGDVVVGVGALKLLGDGTAEIKSMRTHPDHLRKGIADALLRHFRQRARAWGLKRLSLETGSGPAFEPALALYKAHGFESGGAFSDYAQSAFNQFMHLAL